MSYEIPKRPSWHDQDEWLGGSSIIAKKAAEHQEVYTTPIENLTLYIHPKLLSPLYFPLSTWFAVELRNYIVKTKKVTPPKLLEVGIGTGVASLLAAAAGAEVTGVDIYQEAVDVTNRSFRENGLESRGRFLVSDIYQGLGNEKFDYMFWNFPWFNKTDERITERSKDIILDDGYRMVERYIKEGGGRLNPGGQILLGASCYCDLPELWRIAAKYGYKVEVLASDEHFIGPETEKANIKEETYLLRLVAN